MSKLLKASLLMFVITLVFGAPPPASAQEATSSQGPARQFPASVHAPKLAADDSGTDSSADAKTQQLPAKSNAASSNATTTCTHQFTYGSGDTYLQFCVTVNGNIVEFQSPAGIEQIAQGTIGEGYGICDEGLSTQYYDWAGDGDSGNWAAPVLVSESSDTVKIERTTSDGLWTLTQTINLVAGTNPYAKIVMQLKNNADVAKYADLMRWANAQPADPGVYGYKENLDSTFDSAWAYVPIAFGAPGNPPYGLMLQNVGATPFTSRGGYTLNTPDAPPSCDPGAGYNGTLTNVDGSIFYFYELGLMAKGKTDTVSVRYISF